MPLRSCRMCILCSVICGMASAFRRSWLNISRRTYFISGAQSLPTCPGRIQSRLSSRTSWVRMYLFEAVRHLKRHPVVVSACSSAEYGHVPASAIPVTEEQPLQPLHPYGISKVCLDLLAREYFLDYEIPAVNIRLFNTTGPGKTNDAPSDFVRQLIRIKKGLQAAGYRSRKPEAAASISGRQRHRARFLSCCAERKARRGV